MKQIETVEDAPTSGRLPMTTSRSGTIILRKSRLDSSLSAVDIRTSGAAHDDLVVGSEREHGKTSFEIFWAIRKTSP